MHHRSPICNILCQQVWRVGRGWGWGCGESWFHYVPLFVSITVTSREQHGISNHWQLSWFVQQLVQDNNKESTQSSVLAVLCQGNPLVTVGFPSQMANDAERVSMSWCHHALPINMMTSSNGNIFRVTGHLCGEFTGHRWIPHTKASDAEIWCFLWSVPE